MMDDRWPWEDTVSRESNRLFFLVRNSFVQQPFKQLSKWKRISCGMTLGGCTFLCVAGQTGAAVNSGLRGAIAQPSLPIGEPRS
jgi:hypothetical protein